MTQVSNEHAATKARTHSAHSSPRARYGALASAAALQLQSSSNAMLRSVTCEFRDGALLLRGQVTSYYLKQLAQEAVRSLAGVGAIINCVEVVRGSKPRSSGADSRPA
jgi:osmotically-inducible protein OsmY